MTPHPIKLTRKELYEKVWSQPIRTLAKEYGISDVGLKKICKRRDIPTPGLGYWAKVAHGKTVRRVPLLRSRRRPLQSADDRAGGELVAQAPLPHRGRHLAGAALRRDRLQRGGRSAAAGAGADAA